jgi:GTPase Era involved in 16S rRNA processing
MITERINFITSNLRQRVYLGVMGRLRVMEQDFGTIDEFRTFLEELEEELEFEEIKMESLQQIKNESMRQLIIELIKEEVLLYMKEKLDFLITNEFATINPDLSEEEK